MKNENSKLVKYAKPEVLDIGAVAPIYGNADCISAGPTASQTCNNYGTNALNCPTTGTFATNT